MLAYLLFCRNNKRTFEIARTFAELLLKLKRRILNIASFLSHHFLFDVIIPSRWIYIVLRTRRTGIIYYYHLDYDIHNWNAQVNEIIISRTEMHTDKYRGHTQTHLYVCMVHIIQYRWKRQPKSSFPAIYSGLSWYAVMPSPSSGF